MIRRQAGIQFDYMYRIDIELLQKDWLPLQNRTSFQLINYCNAVEKQKNWPQTIKLRKIGVQLQQKQK